MKTESGAIYGEVNITSLTFLVTNTILFLKDGSYESALLELKTALEILKAASERATTTIVINQDEENKK